MCCCRCYFCTSLGLKLEENLVTFFSILVIARGFWALESHRGLSRAKFFAHFFPISSSSPSQVLHAQLRNFFRVFQLFRSAIVSNAEFSSESQVEMIFRARTEKNEWIFFVTRYKFVVRDGSVVVFISIDKIGKWIFETFFDGVLLDGRDLSWID